MKKLWSVSKRQEISKERKSFLLLLDQKLKKWKPTGMLKIDNLTNAINECVHRFAPKKLV